MLRSGKVYKVWIDIEEYDIESGNGQLLDCLNIGSTATFETLDEAEQLANRINEQHQDAPGQVDHA